MFSAQSTTRDYIRAENKLQSISELLCTRVILHQPQVGSLNCYAIIRSIGSKLPSCVRLSCWQYVGDSETRCCILSLWFSDGDYKPEILSRITQGNSSIDKVETSLEWQDAFLSVPRYDWCAPLSHPSSCMLVNYGPLQQSSKEEYKPEKWDATAKYYTSSSASIP